jgi:hypothetical protein
MPQAPSDEHAPLGADRLAGQIMITTGHRHHAATVLIGRRKTCTPDSRHVSPLVARTHGLKR